jgi:8-oxo-dGTP diphosphatase
MPPKTDYVAGFLFHGLPSGDVMVALVRKARPEWQAGRLNGVGGHVEPGEAPLAAMVREFQEEAGLHLVHWQAFARLEGSDFRVLFLSSWVFPGQGLLLRSPADEPVDWYNVANLPPEVLPNLRWLIPAALDPSLPFLHATQP